MTNPAGALELNLSRVPAEETEVETNDENDATADAAAARDATNESNASRGAALVPVVT